MFKSALDYAKQRHTCKSYDESKKIPNEKIEEIKEILRLSISSTNCQPWKFLIASSNEAKEKIAKTCDEKYSFNSKAIREASHVIVFCVKTEMDDEHLKKVLIKEWDDGRYPHEENKIQMDKGRRAFVGFHYNDMFDWLEKQVYISLGSFITSLATMNIDATVMEGFDKEALNKAFALSSAGLKSCVVVPIGYFDKDNDYNKYLPKSRLDLKEVIVEC